MTSSEEPRRALWLGPAVAPALAAGAGLRIHSVFQRAVNLELPGTGRFMALCGPPGGVHPHTVALDRAEDFRTWDLILDSHAGLVEGSLQLQTLGGRVRVRLDQAERGAKRSLASLPHLGVAFSACTTQLAVHLKASGSPLGMPSLWPGGLPSTPLAGSLQRAALDLGAALRAAPADLSRLGPAVAELVGLGAGLTPAGDDFLCGSLAAARAGGPAGLAEALWDAIATGLGSTGGLSAFLLQCGFEGFWPGPLLDLAEALAEERPPEAVAALARLCGLGHSSGADLATGFLYGLETGAMEPRLPIRP